MRRGLPVALAVALVSAGCSGEPTAPPPVTMPASALREVSTVHIGTAVAGGGHHADQGYPDPFATDEAYVEVLATQFSSLTAENQMKWEWIHPGPEEYDFAAADAVVDFAEANDQVVRGHTLAWHSQNPPWLQGLSDEELREALREHIYTVVGRYQGRIQQWDVFNEVFDDTGHLRTNTNPWLRALGEEVIGDAFRWAHEADPDALLFLNDYNVESSPAKLQAYLDLVARLQDDGVPIHGMGLQGHLSLRYPFPADLQASLQQFADLGLQTALTELDVRIPLEGDEPTATQLQEQAEYYQRAVAACLAVAGCDSITLWGVTDRYSWVPFFFPEEGAATVLDEDLTPKPALVAVHEALGAGGASG